FKLLFRLEVVDILNEYTHILVSIPPCKDIGDPMPQHADLLKKRLNNECFQWLCYLSTTGVYGDCGGAWLD
nr:putative NAD(P)-binding Rossmann-fold superfamily protein [Tanacetum cinerariifolium]